MLEIGSTCRKNRIRQNPISRKRDGVFYGEQGALLDAYRSGYWKILYLDAAGAFSGQREMLSFGAKGIILFCNFFMESSGYMNNRNFPAGITGAPGYTRTQSGYWARPKNHAAVVTSKVWGGEGALTYKTRFYICVPPKKTSSNQTYQPIFFG